MANVTIEPPAKSETDRVADIVERYLQAHQPSDYRLVVCRDAIRKGTQRWLVQIGVESQSGAEIRADDLADRIIDTDFEIDRDLPRFIRLTSLLPQPGESI